ncbi:MAG: PLD nuclease N-terminal domain-containing protein [Actinomycetota bacterium]
MRLYGIAAIVNLALAVYSLLDCARSPRSRVRTAPKMVWVVVILGIPLLGPFGWLLLGRPARDSGSSRGPRPPQGPDDDPDFLRGLGGS